MINALSIQTDLAGIEQMQAVGKVDTADAASFISTLIYNDLSAPEKVTYDDALTLVASVNYTQIINTVAALGVNRMTSVALIEDEEIIDFDALSEPDKDKFRALLTLFITHKE